MSTDNKIAYVLELTAHEAEFLQAMLDAVLSAHEAGEIEDPEVPTVRELWCALDDAGVGPITCFLD